MLRKSELMASMLFATPINYFRIGISALNIKQQNIGVL
jgi:hypothetical protein